MSVEALDHINIVTSDLDRAEAFYHDVLLLESRPAPPPLTPATARWMADENGRAILHLNSLDAPRMFDRDMARGPTGALHHVALRCRGYEAMITRLKERKLPFQTNDVNAIGLRQIFVEDPDKIVLELNFFAD